VIKIQMTLSSVSVVLKCSNRNPNLTKLMGFGLRFCCECAVHARASKITTAESNASRRNAVAGIAGWEARIARKVLSYEQESRGSAVFTAESVGAVHCGFLLLEIWILTKLTKSITILWR
jgi:ribosomal protein S26